MYKFIFIIFGFLFFSNVYSQINVFDCSLTNPVVTQPEIESTSDFYKPCIEFSNGSYLFDGNSNHTVTAITHIILKPGFHAGSFTPNGQMHLKIEPKSEIDIALMGNNPLSNIPRYKKMELGIILPDELQVKIDRFINNTFGEKINPFIEHNICMSSN